MNKSIVNLMEKSNIQNFTVYMKDGKIYMYSEHVGKNLEQDKKQFNEAAEFVKFNENLGKYLKGPWKVMKEVFHTN